MVSFGSRDVTVERLEEYAVSSNTYQWAIVLFQPFVPVACYYYHANSNKTPPTDNMHAMLDYYSQDTK